MIRIRWQLAGAASPIALSVLAWAVTYVHKKVLIYNDSLSHLDISRLVVDNLQPGLAQLGSVWLPLNHLLSLPLIWNNWAWHSGFAGSFVSMIAYVLATICVYHLVRELVNRRAPALLGAFAFAINPNLLYLQSTPLTETLFLALLVSSSLFIVKYLKYREPKYLVLGSVLSALQVTTRYDGWFVVIIEALVVLTAELWYYKQDFKKAAGMLVLFVTPPLTAMFLWFLWNFLIFGDALYSFIGPYSAHAQQAAIQAQSGLITKSNLLLSSKAFIYDVMLNVGILVAVTSVLGWLLYLVRPDKTRRTLRLLFAILLSADIAFNVIALYLGFSILNIPALHWNPTHTLAGEYFNVRYGILALPFTAVGFGLLAAKLSKFTTPLLVLVAIIQGGILMNAGLITVTDGTVGSSAFVNQDIAAALHKNVGSGDEVIMSSSAFNGVMFESGLNLRQYIHEGVSTEWKAAIADPATYAKWVVTANSNVGDPVYNSLIIKEQGAFLASYKLIYAGRHANLYERLAPFDQYAVVRSGKLSIDAKPFAIRGVNSYDLAYQSKDQIVATFNSLQQAHVNTIRFWLFGDGNADGFQPEAGIVSESMLQKTDFIFYEAHNYRIRLIPTLVNNFDDYGGINQYLNWVGLPSVDHDQFFTNQADIKLYENYLGHILSRSNSYTGISYKNDPAVLAWDMINEPRTQGGNTAVVATWANMIAQYIKSQDQNHLVTISLDKPTADTGESTICASTYIDFCSVHIYPQDPAIASYQTYSDELHAIQTYKYTAVAILRKPIVVTEIGIAKTLRPFGEQPLTALADSIRAIDQYGYSGWLIWNWSQKPDTSYGFSPSGTSGGYSQTDLAALTQ